MGRISQGTCRTPQPIVVVVDDIDRLESAEIRDIFNLVGLTASFPNLGYLLAFDRPESKTPYRNQASTVVRT